MNASRIAQVEDIYHAALDVAKDEWPSFLTSSCGEDDELRREVESLLSFTDKTLSVIDVPPLDVAAEIVQQNSRPNIVGKTIKHYKILSHLGAGGMGDVFLATDTSLDRRVAIKILSAQFDHDADGLRRFIREAKAASALNHPNIITVHEVSKTRDTPFIATEFIDGKTLRQAMDDGEMTFELRVDIVAQVASALVAAHSAGILHRDIKPENIMLRSDGLVKVLDFGLAKIDGVPFIESDNSSHSAPADPHLSVAGLVMGTLAYMSPEQSAGEPVDARSDIWSLGVVMFELFYGRKPFKGNTAAEVLEALKANGEDPDPLAGGLEKVIFKALRRNPDERYQNAVAMLADLKVVKSAHAGTNAIGDREKLDVFGNEAPARSGLGYAFAKLSGQSAIWIGIMVIAIAIALVSVYLYQPINPAGVNTVAVLAFENATGDSESEYLSESLADSLIGELSQLPGVKVTARGSSFRFSGNETDLQMVGRALGVRALLTGSVSKRDDKLNVRAELVDVADNSALWSGQFGGKPTELIQIRDDIMRQISAKIGSGIKQSTHAKLADSNNADPQAYELLLKGHFYRAKGGAENSKKAIDLYLQALAIDRNYGLAYASVAGTYLYVGQNGFQDPKEMTTKARAAAVQALELDENLAEAHLAMAGVHRLDWNWAGAENEYKRAIELNPNLAAVHFGYSYFLTTQNRHDEAAAEMRLGRELDPLKPSINANIAYGFYFAGKYEQALEQYNIDIELDPISGGGYYGRGLTYAAQGRLKEAISDYRDMLRLGGDHPGVRCYLGAALARDGQVSEAKAMLRRLENGVEYVSPLELAILYVAIGERTKALDALERAYVEHDSQIQFLLVEPGFDSLRSDERFVSLLRKVSLPV